MRKLIITESQVKLINENVDKIEKLLFTGADVNINLAIAIVSSQDTYKDYFLEKYSAIYEKFIGKLPENFEELTYMFETDGIDLHNKKISSKECETLSQMMNLEKMFFRNCMFDDGALENLFSSRSLTSIGFQSPVNIYIPYTIKNAINLTSILISHSDLTSAPTGLELAPQLKRLDLNFNESLKDISALYNVKGLVYLDLSETKVNDDDIIKLKQTNKIKTVKI